MKPIIGLIALLFTTGAFAQTTPPKAVKRPPVQLKPQAPMGCKLSERSKGRIFGPVIVRRQSSGVAHQPPNPQRQQNLPKRQPNSSDFRTCFGLLCGR
jgi:hypothetical protein